MPEEQCNLVKQYKESQWKRGWFSSNDSQVQQFVVEFESSPIDDHEYELAELPVENTSNQAENILKCSISPNEQIPSELTEEIKDLDQFFTSS